MKLSLVSSPVLNSRLSIMPLLKVQDLKIHFPVRGGWFGRATDVIKAVDKVSFDVEEGSTVGLVGESGSGKSTVARALLKLTPVTGGTVTYQGREILSMPENEFRPLRKEMQMVFQDPFGSLNPRFTLEQIVGEGVEARLPNRSARRQAVEQALEKVELPASFADRYPHELSGGQRQRVALARALIMQPKLLILELPSLLTCRIFILNNKFSLFPNSERNQVTFKNKLLGANHLLVLLTI